MVQGKSKEVLQREIEIIKECMIDELRQTSVWSGTHDHTILNNFFEALKRNTIELKKL
jgi:pantothenate kinase-related protein Tda10